jgi:hypothetical protein
VEGKEKEEETRVDETQTAINFSQLQALFVWTRKGRGCEMCLRCSKQKKKTNKQTNERERRQRVAFDKYKRNERLIHRRMQAIILISSRSQHKKKNRNTFKNLRIFSGLFFPSTCLPVFNSIDRKFYTQKKRKKETGLLSIERTNQELVID